jgi:hypothetical protein
VAVDQAPRDADDETIDQELENILSHPAPP